MQAELSGHDSSDQVIAMLSESFGDAHRHIRVGEHVVAAEPDGRPLGPLIPRNTAETAPDLRCPRARVGLEHAVNL